MPGKNMYDELSKARIFSDSVRYSGDTLRVSGGVEHRDSDGLQSYFLLNSILVSPLVTPIIDKSVNKVILNPEIHMMLITIAHNLPIIITN
jgi:hypothetical protein